MSQFPLLLFAGMIALNVASAGAFGDNAAPPPASPPSAPSVPTQSQPGSEAAEQQGGQNLAADLQRRVSDLHDLAKSIEGQLDLREALKSQQEGSKQEDADLQPLDSGLHSSLQPLIEELNHELQFYVQRRPVPDPAEQQRQEAAVNAFRQVIDELQQEDDKLQGVAVQHQQRVTTAPSVAAPAPDTEKKQAVNDPLQQQVADLLSQNNDLQRQNADLQRQNADLQRQNDELRGQLSKQEHAQAVQALVQLNTETARHKTEQLRQDVDMLRQQRPVDAASPERQTPTRQVTAAAPAQRTVPKPPTQPIRLPPKSAPTPQPAQPSPAPSVSQELQSARQWLAAGRQDEARRVLAMVQTQVIFRTPADRAETKSVDPIAADVGDAIRWLDMGARDRAMQSIEHALNETTTSAPPATTGLVRARSGSTESPRK